LGHRIWGDDGAACRIGRPFRYVSPVEDALYFSTPGAATAWLAAGITARATAYLRTDMPGQFYYLMRVTRTPAKALTA